MRTKTKTRRTNTKKPAAKGRVKRPRRVAGTNPTGPDAPLPGRDVYWLDDNDPQFTEKEQQQYRLDERATELHRRGKTYRQIATIMDISKSGAWTRVHRNLACDRDDYPEDPADVRDQCKDVIRQGLDKVMDKAAAGDLSAFRALHQHANTMIRLTKIPDPDPPTRAQRRQLIWKYTHRRPDAPGEASSRDITRSATDAAAADKLRTNRGQDQQPVAGCDVAQNHFLRCRNTETNCAETNATEPVTSGPEHSAASLKFLHHRAQMGDWLYYMELLPHRKDEIMQIRDELNAVEIEQERVRKRVLAGLPPEDEEKAEGTGQRAEVISRRADLRCAAVPAPGSFGQKAEDSAEKAEREAASLTLRVGEAAEGGERTAEVREEKAEGEELKAEGEATSLTLRVGEAEKAQPSLALRANVEAPPIDERQAAFRAELKAILEKQEAQQAEWKRKWAAHMGWIPDTPVKASEAVDSNAIRSPEKPR